MDKGLLAGSEGYTIRVARAGTKNYAESIHITEGIAGVHHFDGIGGKAEHQILPPWRSRERNLNKILNL